MRPYQFSIRTLLILTALVAVAHAFALPAVEVYREYRMRVDLDDKMPIRIVLLSNCGCMEARLSQATPPPDCP